MSQCFFRSANFAKSACAFASICLLFTFPFLVVPLGLSTCPSHSHLAGLHPPRAPPPSPSPTSNTRTQPVSYTFRPRGQHTKHIHRKHFLNSPFFNLLLRESAVCSVSVRLANEQVLRKTSSAAQPTARPFVENYAHEKLQT